MDKDKNKSTVTNKKATEDPKLNKWVNNIKYFFLSQITKDYLRNHGFDLPKCSDLPFLWPPLLRDCGRDCKVARHSKFAFITKTHFNGNCELWGVWKTKFLNLLIFAFFRHHARIGVFCTYHIFKIIDILCFFIC